jgi:hypothetical protein
MSERETKGPKQDSHNMSEGETKGPKQEAYFGCPV